jgi:hypothetical protein
VRVDDHFSPQVAATIITAVNVSVNQIAVENAAGFAGDCTYLGCVIARSGFCDEAISTLAMRLLRCARNDTCE